MPKCVAWLILSTLDILADERRKADVSHHL